jgi:hypothetical protein
MALHEIGDSLESDAMCVDHRGADSGEVFVERRSAHPRRGGEIRHSDGRATLVHHLDHAFRDLVHLLDLDRVPATRLTGECRHQAEITCLIGPTAVDWRTTRGG